MRTEKGQSAREQTLLLFFPKGATMTILLIDDDTRISALLKRMLFEAKYKVIDTNNGATGLELAGNIKPDVILCDIMMPEMDGYEVLKRIKQNAITRTIPFIFISAKDATKEFLDAIGRGADGFITKPVMRQDLLETLEVYA
jgi:CheY-like chemotaxis protein